MSDYKLSMKVLEKAEEARAALKIWLHYVYEDVRRPLHEGPEDQYDIDKKKKIQDMIDYIDDN